MDYLIEIPHEIRPDILDLLERNKLRINWSVQDATYLLTVYYRYLHRLMPYETVEGLVKENVNCSNCRSRALWKLKQEVSKWQDDETRKATSDQ